MATKDIKDTKEQKVQRERAELMEKYSLTDAMLREKCLEEHLVEIGTFIAWRKVGEHLPEITNIDLDDIEEEEHKIENRRRKLVDKWEQTNGHKATYDAMITAMLKANRMDNATNVCNLLNPGQ